MTSPDAPRLIFSRWALLAVLVNCLIIGAILLRGDRRETTPLTTIPTAGAENVSTLPRIQLEYARAVDAGSVATAITLNPAVDGKVSVTGSEVTFQPARPLQSNTNYTLTVRAGVREVDGRVAQNDLNLQFGTRSTRLVVLRPDGTAKSAWGVDPNSGRSWRISQTGSPVAAIVPSPDGDAVAYVQPNGPDRWSLSTVPVDGGKASAIVPNGTGFTTSLSWSPRGDLLAYENSDVLGSQVGDPKIWVVRADGTQTSMLYGRGTESGSNPVWSPDGRELTFYENRFSSIVVFNFTKTLITVPSDVRAPVSWSPDAKGFTYAIRTGDTGARTLVKVARLANGQVEQTSITDGNATELRPVWSPDGSWIAFSRLTQGSQTGIWLVHPDGSGIHPVQSDSGWVYSVPAWAPDSSAVAFSRFKIGNAASRTQTEMWIAPTSGQPRRLDGFGEVVAWVP